MQDAPLVTAFTLTYKNYDKLFETILSILEQDYPAFEYIISDDGSGDFPEDEVREFVETHKHDNLKDFKLLVNKENVGTVCHINNVFRKSTGKYIFDLAANDIYVDRNIMKNIVNIFEDTGCDVIITGRAKYIDNKIVEITPHVGDIGRCLKLDTKEKLYRALVRSEHYGMFVGVNVFYTRESVANLGGFDESYRFLEDTPIIGKFILNYNVKLKPDYTTVLYEGKNGVSEGSKGKIFNPILAEDINYFNTVEKRKHYDDLDKSTQRHVDFGVERAKTTNKFSLLLVCIKYFPRIISYYYYIFCRYIVGLFDGKRIKQLESESEFFKRSN